MFTITKIKDIKKILRKVPTAVALGTFDGVHIGHRSIITRAVEVRDSLKKECGLGVSVVLTFKNHPLSILSPEREPLHIDDIYTKEYYIERLGVDYLVSIPFSSRIARLSPEIFMKALYDYLNVRYIVVGSNYSFGYKGKGNPRLLIREKKRYGFEVEIMPDVQNKGKRVCSTQIRAIIEEGKLSAVNELLGHPFTVGGQVINGDHRGRTIGFPTANLAIEKNRAMLSNGAYAVEVLLGSKVFKGIANIGDNPTFVGCYRRLETHILDFSDDIYGDVILVRFIKKLRNQQKFSGIEALKTQLKIDKDNARRILE